MIHFSAVDIVLIVIYFAAILWVGFRSRGGSMAAGRREGEGSWAGESPGGSTAGAADFILAGRSLTLPVFVATLVSTWYGGILGTGEYAYSFGLASWVIFGAPYYFFALIFALFLAGRVRETGLLTIPDKLAHHYGQPAALLGALLVFLLVTPAPYLLMLGVLARLIFGLPLPLTLVLTTLVSMIYLIKGGFRANVMVNLVEFLLMFLGFFLIVGFALHHFGGLGFLRLNLPPANLTWSGGNPPQFILVWFFIALWTLVDPGFHQRCYAARDSATARRGILVSILFWMLFDFLTTTTGLYARAAMPGLESPIFSYPLLAERLLPPVAKGLFFIGLLATIMSTLSSYAFIGGMTIGNDIAGRLVRWRRERRRALSGQHERGGGSTPPDAHEPGGEAAALDGLIRRWTQIGLLIASLYGIVLALALPSVVRIWYAVGTACIPGLLLPVVAGYLPGIVLKPRHALAAMLGGWLLSLTWLLWGLLHDGRYWLGIEPMYPGLALSLLIGLAGIRRARTQ